MCRSIWLIKVCFVVWWVWGYDFLIEFVWVFIVWIVIISIWELIVWVYSISFWCVVYFCVW